MEGRRSPSVDLARAAEEGRMAASSTRRSRRRSRPAAAAAAAGGGAATARCFWFRTKIGKLRVLYITRGGTLVVVGPHWYFALIMFLAMLGLMGLFTFTFQPHVGQQPIIDFVGLALCCSTFFFFFLTVFKDPGIPAELKEQLGLHRSSRRLILLTDVASVAVSAASTAAIEPEEDAEISPIALTATSHSQGERQQNEEAAGAERSYLTLLWKPEESAAARAAAATENAVATAAATEEHSSERLRLAAAATGAPASAGLLEAATAAAAAAADSAEKDLLHLEKGEGDAWAFPSNAKVTPAAAAAAGRPVLLLQEVQQHGAAPSGPLRSSSSNSWETESVYTLSRKSSSSSSSGESEDSSVGRRSQNAVRALRLHREQQQYQLPQEQQHGEEDEELILCDICSVWTARSYEHCDDCGVCIEGHDHHCPWTSKCIGKGNVCVFYSWVLSGLTSIIFYGFAAGVLSTQQTNQDMARWH